MLTKMNFATQYLADENQVNETKNPITHHVKTEGRTIRDKAHQELYKEKEEIKARKRKKRNRANERAREKRENKKLKKQQAKKKDRKGSTISKARNDGGKQREKQRKAEWRKEVPSKTTTKSLWTIKFRQNLKELVCDESSTDENNSGTCFEY